jgi:hypothetical protein
MTALHKGINICLAISVSMQATFTMVIMSKFVIVVTWGEGILREDGITQPDNPSTRRSLIPDNSDVTGAIRKSQGSDSGESARIVTAYIS